MVGARNLDALLFNPTDQPIEKTVALPLYYAGLEEEAQIRWPDGTTRTSPLDQAINVHVLICIPPREMTWLLIKAS